MSDKETFSEAEAHRHFAIRFNSMTWNLLDKAGRTPEEDEWMLYSAIASCRHWLEAGKDLHHERGEWLIARVYAVLGLDQAALRHANRCLTLTEQYTAEMVDFDRAYAIAGNHNEALKYIARADGLL
jgi:hypothetical protein